MLSHLRTTPSGLEPKKSRALTKFPPQGKCRIALPKVRNEAWPDRKWLGWSSANVRFGSEADIEVPLSDVRFTPNIGHDLSALQCLLSDRMRTARPRSFCRLLTSRSQQMAAARPDERRPRPQCWVHFAMIGSRRVHFPVASILIGREGQQQGRAS